MEALRCVVIGHGNFARECAAHLMSCGHDIAAIVTRSPLCRAWAQREGLLVSTDWYGAVPDGGLLVTADFLAPVPGEESRLALRLGLPAVDPALGLAAALASGRRGIGAAWTLAARTVWAGEVALSPDDTAAQALDRCYDAAFESFVAITTALARGEDLAEVAAPAATVPDPLILSALLRLHFELPQAVLAALPRAVDFGDHDAPLASLRLWLYGDGRDEHGHDVASGIVMRGLDPCIPVAFPPVRCDGVIVRQIGTEESPAGAAGDAPGIVVALEEGAVVVAATDGLVRLSGLKTPDGAPLAAGQVAARFRIGDHVGTSVDEPVAVAWAMRAAEAYWRTALERLAPGRLDFLASLGSDRTTDLTNREVEIIRARVPLPADSSALSFAGLLAAAAALVARLSASDVVSLGVALPRQTDPFVARLLPLTLDLNGLAGGYAGLYRAAEDWLAVAMPAPMPAELQRQIVVDDGPRPWSEMVPLAVLADDATAPEQPPCLRVTLDAEDRVAGARLEWASGTREATFVEAMAQALAAIWSAGLADPAHPVEDLPLLSASASDVIRAFSQGPAMPLDADATLASLLAAAAARHADRPALTFASETLSYADLRRRVVDLAGRIRTAAADADADALTDRPVALLFERGIAMVVAILATLEAGAAYLPIDPHEPASRLAGLLSDAAPVLAVAEAALASRLPPDLSRLVIDAQGVAEGEAQGTVQRLDGAPPSPGDLAYVIFTSGSTGRPKGAMLEHRGVVNRITWMQRQYRLSVGDRVLQKTPYTFDVSVWEFLWPLIEGAELVVAHPDGHKDPAYLIETIRCHRITDVHFVPSMLAVFLGAADVATLSSLKRIYCSGEALPELLAARCLARLPHAELHNLYGPTEASIDVSAWQCRLGTPSPTPIVPIGRPIDNMQLHILDHRLQALPIGVPGELCIGGVGVARGYLNRPELTAERFVANPFATADGHGKRLYRTGDLARWLPDGSIEFLGRSDQQVKIRGLRVELGEIEAVLLEQPGIAHAAVARLRVGEHERTVAYLVASNGRRDVTRLGRALAARLPDYMVPDDYVVLDALPLSANGKLDRRALPAPPPATMPAASAVDVGSDPTLTTLAAIWRDVLRVPQVGADDHFFRLGGTSLLAGEMILRVHERLRAGLTFRAVYEHPTLGALARHLGSAAAPVPRRLVVEAL